MAAENPALVVQVVSHELEDIGRDVDLLTMFAFAGPRLGCRLLFGSLVIAACGAVRGRPRKPSSGQRLAGQIMRITPSPLPRTPGILVGDKVADELIVVQRILSSRQFRRIPADQLNLIAASNRQVPTVSSMEL